MLAAMNAIPTQQILALNDAESSENRIHSDEIAHKYGFNGALVSGVNVFGYLSQPLVRIYGEEWLRKGILDVRFLKPAYQDNLLTVQTETTGSPQQGRNHQTSISNEDGVQIATLESWLPAELPAIDGLASASSAPAGSQRHEIHWDLIQLQQPAPSFLWQPTEDDNMQRVNAQRDQAALYQGSDGYIHPYYLLDSCNKALMRMFMLPAWIHTGSRVIIRKALKVGDSISVNCTPIEKWERKGHQFIKLYIAMWTNGEVATEVEHTAIFKIAE